MLCRNGTVKPFLVSLVEPVAYLKSELLPRYIFEAESVSCISCRHSHGRLLVDRGRDPRWRLPIKRRNWATRRRLSWDCRWHRGDPRRSVCDSLLLAVSNYGDWRICMGIVNAKLFVVGSDEDKMESKSCRLQCIEFWSRFHRLRKLLQTMERHARLGEILLPLTSGCSPGPAGTSLVCIRC